MNLLDLGVPVFQSARIERDQVVAGDGSFFVHPVTFIALQHPHDPYEQLDATINWHLQRALLRLDQVMLRHDIKRLAEMFSE